MDRRTVITKTAKGLMEITGKTSLLPRDLRNVLSHVDGKATVGELHHRIEKLSEVKLFNMLGKLISDGFVREFVAAPASMAPPSRVRDGLDLDFSSLLPKPKDRAEAIARTQAEADEVALAVAQARERQEAGEKAKAEAEARLAAKAAQARAELDAQRKREADEKAKREAEEKAKREAEEKAKREAEAKAKREAEEKAKREAEAKSKREAEEKAKREAEAKAKREAEETARREAEAKAKREAEERAKREAEEKARREAEAKAKREAEEKAKREAEAKAKREAEEKAKREAEAKSKREAEEKAKREAEEKAKREAEEKAKREAEAKAKREAEERAKREAEEKARREAEAKVKREAEEKAKREAEEKAKREAEARRVAEEKAKREAEERAQREEEERIRRELEERVRQAEAQARLEAEEREKREAAEAARLAAEAERRREAEAAARRADQEERERREAEERARRFEAEEAARRKEQEKRVRREAEAQARQQAEEAERRRQDEERARQRAEEQALREAEEAARRQEEEERVRREAERREREEEKARAVAETEAAARARREERAREKAEADARIEAHQKEQAKEAARVAARLARIRSGKKGGLGKGIAAALALLVIGGLAYLHFSPLDVSKYEQLATKSLGVPVKIGAGNIALFPSPAVRLERLTIGTEDSVRIAVANATPNLIDMLSGGAQLRAIELQGVNMDAAALGELLFGRAVSGALGVERVHATGVRLALPGAKLPDLEIKATVRPDGAVTSVVLSDAGKTISAELQPQPDGKALVELSVARANEVLALPFLLESLSATGLATPTEFDVATLHARFFDGTARGKGRLTWAGPLAFDASLELKQVDVKRLAPVLAGRIAGSAVITARADALDGLGARARVDGSFSVQKGAISGIDLPRVIQTGKAVPGSTNFNELSARAELGDGRLALRAVKLDAGQVSASGSIDVENGKLLAGKFAADMKTPGGALRTTLNVSGTPSQLNVKR
jgi:hypothetical protein